MEPVGVYGTRKNPIVINYPPTPERFHAINIFAHEFDGYAAYGDELGKIANEMVAQWHVDTSLPEDLVLLRSCLFFEARRAHFIDGYPGEADMAYLDALVAEINALMSEG